VSRCGFGERLRALREARGLNQCDLALKVGTVQSAVCHWESGSRTPSFTSLENLADALGVSLDRLMRGHDYVPGGVP
jgi:transcriptional regulator with XRE-family HTH domain